MDRQPAGSSVQQAEEDQRQSKQSARAMRWINRVIAASFLTAATVMGVQLGMNAPTVSPVSPPAIAEQASRLSGDSNVVQMMPNQREGGHHQRRGRL